MVVGGRDKNGRKKEKEGRGFERLLSFLSPPFLFVLSRFFLLVILVQIWLYFLCFGESITFEFLTFLIVILFGRWEESGFVVIRVRVEVKSIMKSLKLYIKNFFIDF